MRKVKDHAWLETTAYQLQDEGYEVLKDYLPGTDILKGFEVTDTGEYFHNEGIEGDTYALQINDGTEGAWRE